MKIIKKAVAFFTVAALALTLCACNEKRVGFTMHTSEVPQNLDPQAAALTSEIISTLHLFNALFRKAPNGKIEAEAAESYTTSANGLVYTIKLKPGQAWQSYTIKDGDATKTFTPPLTANDFVFGLQRVFMPETKSPYVDALSVIKNGYQIQRGELDASSLGVRAIDDLTLEIELLHPDPMFIERLCLPGAMPCNREFFDNANGAYGLSGKTLLTNGRFTLNTWRSGIDIGMKKLNPEPGAINYLSLYTPKLNNVKDTTALSRLENEETNGELLEGSVTDTPYNSIIFSTISWVLSFNCANSPFDNQNLRTALSISAYNADYSSDYLIKSEGLVPPSITMLDKSYRDYAGNTLSSGDATLYFRNGMNEEKLSKLSNITVLVPNDGDFENIFSEINQQWQRELAVYFSIKAVDRETLMKAVESGNYQIALMPLQQSENDVLPSLARFAKNDNASRYVSENYKSVIAEINATPSGDERADLYKRAESLLQYEAPIIPLFYETSTYLYSNNIQNLVISPYGPIIDVSFAKTS